MENTKVYSQLSVANPNEALFLCRLTSMIHGLRGDGLEPEVLISNLEYVKEVLGVLAQKAEYVIYLLISTRQ